MSLAEDVTRNRVRIGTLLVLSLLVGSAVLALRFDVSPDELLVTVRRIFTYGFITRSLEMATPIALAAIGGLYAEKSGVFNIGLEGFMIFGAFSAAATMYFLGGTSPSQGHVWVAVLAATIVTALLTVVFAVLLIRYKADQIVAGLAVWFLGLGFAPFTAAVIWGSRSSPGLESVATVAFGQSPFVLLTVLVVLASWVFLYRTQYGYWVQAAGENPEALDTAGIDVNRVRYATVIFSGAMAGLGGAVLLAHAGNFVGTGETMVDGRGWIGIVAYLFGNYNPIGAAAAALLFGALDMLNVQFQTVGIEASARLVNLLPYAAVIVVLSAWGKTRMPSSVGEPYESEE
ncbi:ABC transporter permease [Halobiforma lacisalsi AJ5]|uniref:ABC transporter permease n=1 Tax=Natronobacterium lacisalsi AJ5 TaxID=358396 RepID=M0L4I3_NATLA|nr:ABC transporter permease [Halobiforma lacisalsi]APW98086.1 ABC transporter permease [Halobiforma lacisalsi AJ5]EMA28466.1 inner-membrane translocator [Halobiforma lacisalsi AJ5]